MKIVDTGGLAFPSAYGTTNGNDGLTMRDYFAGQALASFDWAHRETTYEQDARQCYQLADAMIKARSGHGRPTGEA
jgi:hypothetical protein